MEEPKVLIGITTKNRSQRLIECVESLRLLNYPNLSVRVFCDGCTDNTVVALTKYPEIEVIVNAESIGLKRARNTLMSARDFKYFVTLDDDTFFLHASTLTKCINFLEKNENIGILSFDIRDIKYKNSDTLSTKVKPFQISEFIGCGNIIKVDVINNCGFYNEVILPYGAEEQELSINCLKKKYLIYYFPGAILIHNEEKNNRSYSRQWKSTVNNVLYISAIYYPKYIWPFLLPIKIFTLFKHGLLNNKLWPTFNGFFYFLFKQTKRKPLYFFGRLTFSEFKLFRYLKTSEKTKKQQLLNGE